MKKKLSAQDEIANLENRLAKANAEIDNLHQKLEAMTIKYYDMFAVMRYLESKLSITRK
jgi:hypothetical protein